MFGLRKAISILNYDDQLSTARVLESLWQRAKEYQKKEDLAGLKMLSQLIDEWHSSINKWKVYCRRILMNLSRAEQDLESLSLRIRQLEAQASKSLGIKKHASSFSSQAQVQDTVRGKEKDREGRGPNLQRGAYKEAMERESREN